MPAWILAASSGTTTVLARTDGAPIPAQTRRTMMRGRGRSTGTLRDGGVAAGYCISVAPCMPVAQRLPLPGQVSAVLGPAFCIMGSGWDAIRHGNRDGGRYEGSSVEDLEAPVILLRVLKDSLLWLGLSALGVSPRYRHDRHAQGRWRGAETCPTFATDTSTLH